MGSLFFLIKEYIDIRHGQHCGFSSHPYNQVLLPPPIAVTVSVERCYRDSLFFKEKKIFNEHPPRARHCTKSLGYTGSKQDPCLHGAYSLAPTARLTYSCSCRGCQALQQVQRPHGFFCSPAFSQHSAGLWSLLLRSCVGTDIFFPMATTSSWYL